MVVWTEAFTLVARISKKMLVSNDIVDLANVLNLITYINCTSGGKNPQIFLGQIENANRFSMVKGQLVERQEPRTQEPNKF